MGLSQAELGRAIGVHRHEISRWESGKNEPTIENREQIARFAHVESELMFPSARAYPGEPHGDIIDGPRDVDGHRVTRIRRRNGSVARLQIHPTLRHVRGVQWMVEETPAAEAATEHLLADILG